MDNTEWKSLVTHLDTHTPEFNVVKARIQKNLVLELAEKQASMENIKKNAEETAAFGQTKVDVALLLPPVEVNLHKLLALDIGRDEEKILLGHHANMVATSNLPKTFGESPGYQAMMQTIGIDMGFCSESVAAYTEILVGGHFGDQNKKLQEELKFSPGRFNLSLDCVSRSGKSLLGGIVNYVGSMGPTMEQVSLGLIEWREEEAPRTSAPVLRC